MTTVIYFIERESDKLIKIGFTTNLLNRLASLKAQHGPMKLLGIVDGGRVTATTSKEIDNEHR